MRHALEVGWGDVGGRVADCWAEYNRLYFGGRLRPLPIFLTPSAPYGKRIGWTCCGGAVTHIALCAPRHGTVLVADRCTLLHEMIHQCLHEGGEFPCPDGPHSGPWCREIMRLHRQITGKEIWAGRYTVQKGKDRRSVRGNLPHPDTGRPSIPQAEIARWPHDSGIKLGPL
jgi:hypothetical protein